MMGFGMMGGGIMWILIIGLAIYLIANNQRNISNNYSNDRYRNNDALEILKERYAKGETTEEEYLRKRKILKG
ncbi:SHOCT domain-containing protein [Wukongibacter baidiensis]|uniref:SHOCT domain-containing protein n=1 Tax=Wukongibacter baidiensis TaxID=1723361 RepID=UPI003D7F8D50